LTETAELKEGETEIWKPQEGMQEVFCESSETEIFYGGQAGGGKSIALIIIGARYISEPNYKAIIFRRTFPETEELITEARKIYTPLGGVYKGALHAFVWSNGAKVMFSHMQHIKDIYSHMGRQYDFIGFDELTHFPKLAYTYLFSRLRGTNPKIKKFMRSTGNPDGPGLLWVKNRFYDPMTPLQAAFFKTFASRDVKVTQDTPGAISRKFVPCVRSENKALMDNDPEYENRLDQLPEDKKRALKEGLWTLMDKPDQLIQSEWWEAATNGANPYHDDGNYTIGADFGTHQGVDKSVEFVGKGNRPYSCRSWPKTKTTQFAQILADSANSVTHNRVMIGIDSIGPGTGVADELEEHHKLAAIVDRCSHKDPIFDEKYIGDIQFDNLRSQMWWKMKKDMEDGLIDLSLFQGAAYFEDYHELEEEILAHTFRVYNGKLIVVSKEELRKPEHIGRSPDYADALVIWNWTRRHHMTREVNADADYEVDDDMKAMFDDSEDDEADTAEYDEDDPQFDELDGFDEY